MKKLLFFMSVIMMAVMTSCSDAKSDPKSIHEKITNGSELNQSDYSVMIDYMADGAKKAMDVFNSESSIEDITKSGEQLEKEYPYMQEFIMKLNEVAANGKLNSDNQKKLDKINEEFYNM